MPWQKLPDLPACPCSACEWLSRATEAHRKAIHRRDETLAEVQRAAAVVDRRHGLATPGKETPL